MKRLFLVPLVLLTLALAQAGQAIEAPPYFGGLRIEVTNQLALASNAVPRSTSLILALKKALRTIDTANPTNLVKDAKSLSLLASTLNRTVLSNLFDLHLQGLADLYVDDFTVLEDELSDRLALTYPSRSHTAALKSLGRMLAALQVGSTNVNTTKATRSIYRAGTNFSLALKQVARAEAALAPASRIIARVTGAAPSSTFRTSGLSISNPTENNFNLIGVHASLNGHIVSFTLYGVNDGTSTVPITEGSLLAGTLHPRSFSENITGTATVTRIPGLNTLYGTFTFTAVDEDNPAASATITGTFFGTYL